jgi:hypothetical protein
MVHPCAMAQDEDFAAMFEHSLATGTGGSNKRL